MSFYDDASLIMYPSGYKEDKIYSLKPTNGTGDLNFSRASSATRVNSEGLIETASVLGAEEVTNGDFSADSDWTKGTGWSISAGSARFNSASTYTFLSQDLGTIVGNTYLIKLSCTVTSGDLNITLADDPNFRITTTGVYEFKLTPTGGGSSDTLIRIYTTIASSNTSIDNISVKEVITSNVPRIDYSNECGSLLLEKQSTNLVTYSEDFSNAAWIKTDITITSNNATSPDGTQNADKLTEGTATASRHGLYQNVSGTANVSKTLSCFVKKNIGDFVQLSFNDSQPDNWVAIVANLSTGQIVDTASAATATYENSKIESFENGWYRISVTGKYNTATYHSKILTCDSASPTRDNYGNAFFNGNGTRSFYIYGAQLEQSSYPTSYIISNSGTSTTRIADSASKTGISSLINSTEGVLYAEIAALADDGTNRYISLSDGSTSNVVWIRYMSTSNQVEARCKVSGATTGLINFTVADTTLMLKIAFKWKDNDFALWINGAEEGVVSVSGVTNAANTLTNFNFNDSTSFPFYGNVQNLMVFPSALTDDELADLTGAVHQTFNSLANFYNYTIL